MYKSNVIKSWGVESGNEASTCMQCGSVGMVTSSQKNIKAPHYCSLLATCTLVGNNGYSAKLQS